MEFDPFFVQYTYDLILQQFIMYVVQFEIMDACFEKVVMFTRIKYTIKGK